ncbi:hypothetical protein WJX77_011502 [Trebouxia sp. C0004]
MQKASLLRRCDRGFSNNEQEQVVGGACYSRSRKLTAWHIDRVHNIDDNIVDQIRHNRLYKSQRLCRLYESPQQNL